MADLRVELEELKEEFDSRTRRESRLSPPTARSVPGGRRTMERPESKRRGRPRHPRARGHCVVSENLRRPAAGFDERAGADD